MHVVRSPPVGELERLLEAVRNSPDDGQLRIKAGIAMLEGKRYPEALVHLQRAVELAPDSAQAHDSLGIGLVRLNRVAEAEPHFVRALDLNPANDMTKQRLVWVRQQLGR